MSASSTLASTIASALSDFTTTSVAHAVTSVSHTGTGSDEPQSTESTTRSAQQETATKAGEGYTYSSSTIVRVTLAASVIVLGICALLLFMKVSQWVRYRQRLSRERALRKLHASEQRARAFELAAWADTPGQAPVSSRDTKRRPWWKRRSKEEKDKDKAKVVRGRGLRGKTNAYAVYEWEGVPA